jgi:hypothetical protein
MAIWLFHRQSWHQSRKPLLMLLPPPLIARQTFKNLK